MTEDPIVITHCPVCGNTRGGYRSQACEWLRKHMRDAHNDAARTPHLDAENHAHDPVLTPECVEFASTRRARFVRDHPYAGIAVVHAVILFATVVLSLAIMWLIDHLHPSDTAHDITGAVSLLVVFASTVWAVFATMRLGLRDIREARDAHRARDGRPW